MGYFRIPCPFFFFISKNPNVSMISKDLTRNIKISLKTTIGQLGYVERQIDLTDPSNILLQLKAVQAMLSKITFELLDETYRKALAEKVVANHEACPGNCGNEASIQKMLKLFPEIELEDIPSKLKEAQLTEQNLKKFLLEKNLDTPPL